MNAYFRDAQVVSQPRNMRQKPLPTLKIIPMGGLEEIGKNMTILEYGNDIVVIDMGLMFPRSAMPGVDYLIPDVSYLEKKKDKIRGVIITHGHLDHTGAVPYIIEKLGLPPIYGTPITLGMVKGRLAEFNLVEKCTFKEVKEDADTIQLGAIRINIFRLLHNIPGQIGLEIETPERRVVYCADWKFDYNPADGKGVDFHALAAIGNKGVDLLISDSTGADKPGHTVSEKIVEESLSKAIENLEGRIVIAMLSTLLNRVQQVLNIAARNNRKVLICGRSMQQNVDMAIELGAIIAPPKTLITEREVASCPANKLIVLTTGSQGEDGAALGRMARREHRVIKLHRGDTVLLSASLIPGNEQSVKILKNSLYAAGATVITNTYLNLDIHASGHAHQDDLKLMIALMKPKYFMPMHGEAHHLRLHRQFAEEVGVLKDNIIAGENGSILEVHPDGRVSVSKEHVEAGYIMIDGLGVGDVGQSVLRERQQLGQEGFLHVICVVDETTKQVYSPDIISRGFIYLRENEQLIGEVRQAARTLLQQGLRTGLHMTELHTRLEKAVQKMLFEKTGRSPLVVPLISSVHAAL